MWLDDYKIATLPDDKWREFVTSYANDPANVRFETYRDEYNKLRSKIKKAVFARDQHKCRKCGATDNLEIDHIVPLVRGGSNDLNNIQILCMHCNRTKSDRLE